MSSGKPYISSSINYETLEETLDIKPQTSSLFIGIPKEEAFQENRIALSPDAVAVLTGAASLGRDFFDAVHGDDGAVLTIRCAPDQDAIVGAIGDAIVDDLESGRITAEEASLGAVDDFGRCDAAAAAFEFDAVGGTLAHHDLAEAQPLDARQGEQRAVDAVLQRQCRAIEDDAIELDQRCLGRAHDRLAAGALKNTCAGDARNARAGAQDQSAGPHQAGRQCQHDTARGCLINGLLQGRRLVASGIGFNPERRRGGGPTCGGLAVSSWPRRLRAGGGGRQAEAEASG